MRLLFLCGILLTISTTALAEDVSLDEPAVHKAIQKSLTWLQNDMQVWREERGCAACHHGPMYLWSVSVAKQQGYKVNEPQLREFTRWLLTDDEARIFPKQATSTPQTVSSANVSDRMTAAMMGRRNLSQPTIYLVHALNALPDDEPLKKIGWQRVIEHLASAQQDDGSFAGRNAWRPIFNTPQILTRFVASGVRDSIVSHPMEVASEKQRVLLNQADAFLSKQVPDETHQGIVLQLLSDQPSSRESANKRPQNDRAKLIERLSTLQRSDGGWSQTDDRTSDAFATGQTLLVLHRAGVSSASPAVRNGIGFLLRTQLPNGSWPMASRPNPETGNPAEFLNPITYAATAWATLGLTTCVPKTSP